MRVVSKKKLTWQARNIQDFAESFPENSLEISRKSGNFWTGWKYLGCPRTVVFHGNTQYFRKIHRTNFMIYQVSLESLKLKVRGIFGNLFKLNFQIFSKLPDSLQSFQKNVETDRSIKNLTDIFRHVFKNPVSPKVFY